VVVEVFQEFVQVGFGVAPGERSGEGVVPVLERGEPLSDLVQVGEVVGGDDFRWMPALPRVATET